MVKCNLFPLFKLWLFFKCCSVSSFLWCHVKLHWNQWWNKKVELQWNIFYKQYLYRLQKWKQFCKSTIMLCQHAMFLQFLQRSSGELYIYKYFKEFEYYLFGSWKWEVDWTYDFLFGCSESPDRKGKITVQMKQVWNYILLWKEKKNKLSPSFS